jgi:hypothetical protein
MLLTNCRRSELPLHVCSMSFEVCETITDHERTPVDMRHLKILGLSALALVGIMAVSASAAQATWVLDGGVTLPDGKLLLSLEGGVLLGELLVPGLGIEIHCTGGTAHVHLLTHTDMKTLNASGHAVFSGCKVLNFSAVCKVKSSTTAAGEILAEGSGTVSMNGSETYALLSSTTFTTIEFEGAECPFIETDGRVNGNVKLTFHNPQTSEATHLALLNDDGLFLGDEPATIHGELLPGGGGLRDDAQLTHLQKVGGGSWALLLSGL